MRRILILACVAAVLAGCASTVSSIYGGAHENGIVENKDGSTTFEFKFMLDPFDATKAMQRIDEFLAGYAGKKGFASYEVESVNGKAIPYDRRGAGSWVVPAGAGLVLGPSDKMIAGGKDQYGRILVQARFTSTG